MDTNFDNSSLKAALVQAIATLDVAIDQLAAARANLAPHLPPARALSPTENFTPDRLQQAYATQARIEDEIAEVERDRDDEYLTGTEAKARLEPLEDMLEHVMRFIDDCRAHLALKGDQPTLKAQRVANYEGGGRD